MCYKQKEIATVWDITYFPKRFWRDSLFFKSPMLEKPISFLRKLVSFRKCFQQIAPTDWKHVLFFQNTIVFSKHFLFRQNTFQKCFESILPQNTFVFCHKPNNCYHIICKYPTVMQIKVITKDDLRPHRPPPLPLSAPCWRRHHRCHGCRIVDAIAVDAIAAATAVAAAISAVTSTVSAAIATAFWHLTFS